MTGRLLDLLITWLEFSFICILHKALKNNFLGDSPQPGQLERYVLFCSVGFQVFLPL